MFSDRKASRVLGVTVLRAPRLTFDQKASKILGAEVVKSGIDFETRPNERPIRPGSRLREKLLTTKMGPLVLRGPGKRERASGREGQKVVLSPKWKPPRVLRRHTISYEPGLNLLVPLPPPSPSSLAKTLSPTAQVFAELLTEDGERGGLGLDSDVAPIDAVAETVTPADIGAVPLQAPSPCPPSPVDPLTPRKSYEVPASPTARNNPMSQKRREMIRSANKSVQILGIEARRVILKKMEKENAGRIGWTGV